MSVTANILDPIQDQLDQTIFKKQTPRATVVSFIKRKFYEAMDNIVDNPEFYFELVLTGSLTTYQYSESSDCDISVYPQYDELASYLDMDDNELRRLLIQTVTTELDGTFIPGTTHPLQYFVVNPGDDVQARFAKGVRSGWSFEEKGWINPPEKNRVHDISVEFPDMYQRAADIADKMRILLDEGKDDDAKILYDQIHAKRTADQNEGLGDFSEGNITYKFLLHEGLFARLEEEAGVHIAKLAHDSQRTFGNKTSFIYVPQLDKIFWGNDHPSLWMRDLPVALGLVTPEESQDLLERYWDGDTELLDRTNQMRTDYGKSVIMGWIDNSGELHFNSESADTTSKDVALGLQNHIRQLVRESNRKISRQPPYSTVFHIAPKRLRQQILTNGIDSSQSGVDWRNSDPEYANAPVGNYVWSDPEDAFNWGGDDSDVWEVYTDRYHWNPDPYASGAWFTQTPISPQHISLTKREHHFKSAKVQIVYDFDNDKLTLVHDHELETKPNIIVGTYEDDSAHLHHTANEWINANYFKRLWLNTFPDKKLKEVYIEGTHVPTRPENFMTYVEKNPAVVTNPQVFSRIATDPWRKGRDWKDYIKNKGIIVDFQMGDKKDEKFEARVKEIHKDKIRVEVAPGEFRVLDDELLHEIKFKVRDDKRTLSHWVEAGTPTVLRWVMDDDTGVVHFQPEEDAEMESHSYFAASLGLDSNSWWGGTFLPYSHTQVEYYPLEKMKQFYTDPESQYQAIEQVQEMVEDQYGQQVNDNTHTAWVELPS